MRSLLRWLITAGAFVALALTGAQAASATPTGDTAKTAAETRIDVATGSEVSAAQSCGFVGGETYRHCSTWTHVYIDAQNIWGTTYRDICVGPGDTHLGYLSYWVISYAWYTGKTC